MLLQILQQKNWDTNNAVEHFFEKNIIAQYGPKINEQACKNLFREYANANGVMDEDGIVKFFQHIRLDTQDAAALAISYKMGAKQQGQYTREEFVKGCMGLGADSLKAW